jgi:ABC-type phosphate transport system permease subunit
MANTVLVVLVSLYVLVGLVLASKAFFVHRMSKSTAPIAKDVALDLLAWPYVLLKQHDEISRIKKALDLDS